MIEQRLLTYVIASTVLTFAIGACAPASRTTPTPLPTGTQEDAPNLPEAHGSIDFQPEFKRPAPRVNTQAREEEPVVIDTTEVPVSKRHPLCQDAYDKKPMLKGVNCPQCNRGDFTQPEPKRVKLDLLFVADSSPSLETERTAIGKGVRQFVNALSSDTDYRIGVIAAHSDVTYDASKNSTGLAGQLLVAGSEPAVLKKSDFKDWSELSKHLTRKLTKIKSDAASDGGELGLFSLDKAISQPLLNQNQKLGFFRPDAALAIIFISDENDICSYNVNYPAGVEPKKNVNMFGKSGLTVEEKANQVYCRDAQGNPTVTSRSVFEKLRNLKKIANSQKEEAMPLLVSGILYTEESTVPTTPAADEKFPEYFSENEVGYGYLDLIRDNQGVAVDISKGNFNDGLRQIGEAAALKLEVKSEFKLGKGSSVDPNSICVLVDGQEVEPVADFTTKINGLSYVFVPGLRELHLRGIGPRNGKGEASKVDVFYCEPPSVIHYDPELYFAEDVPTPGQHYRNIPIPSGCKKLKARINAGAFDQQ